MSGCQLTAKEDEEKAEQEGNLKVNDMKEEAMETSCNQITSWATLCPLLITCYLHFVQNWCGVNVIVFKVT